ncbi:MAG: tetratricopeptide repeat protein [Candidatus Sulfotelmatobacter sp.]
MGERFTLDVDSFQRLLAAAWVLQCEGDRKSAEIGPAADNAVLLGRRINRIPANFPIPSYIFETESGLSGSRVLNADRGSSADVRVSAQRSVATSVEIESAPNQAPVLGPKPAASVSLQPEVSGTLALAPERYEIAEPNVIPFLLAELQEESVWEKIERAMSGAAGRVALRLTEWSGGWRSRLRVKVIIRGRAKDEVGRYAAPGFALLIVGVMLIPQLSSRVGWLRSVKAASHLSGSSVGTGGTGPALETSHLRVTDAADSAALDQMSRYEVQSMRRQAQFGDDTAALTLAMAYETGRGVPQSCREAARWVELSAEDGNAAAEYNLGLRYLSGDGIREDRAEGRKWLEAAARQGYEKSRLILQGMNL